MKPLEIYKNVFGILRIDNRLKENNARVVGTGFIINTNPLYVLTCNHVVGEGTEHNDGNISYALIKRSDSNAKDFDLGKFEITFLKAKKIVFKPEVDLAVLTIDTSIDPKAAEKMGLLDIEGLELDFDSNSSEMGLPVEWISAGTLGDFSITPRLFKGNIVTKYSKNNQYKFTNPDGVETTATMHGINLFEVDQLFFPGCSGSPILSPANGKVIGWVHGFNSWQLPPNVTASLSIGISMSNIQDFLKESNFIK